MTCKRNWLVFTIAFLSLLSFGVGRAQESSFEITNGTWADGPSSLYEIWGNGFFAGPPADIQAEIVKNGQRYEIPIVASHVSSIGFCTTSACQHSVELLVDTDGFILPYFILISLTSADGTPLSDSIGPDGSSPCEGASDGCVIE